MRAVNRQLAGRRYDLLLDMHPSMRANLVSLAVKAPLKIGFDRARAKDQQWLFTNRRIAPAREQHVMDAFFGFAEAVGISERDERWDIPIPDSDREFAVGVVDGKRKTAVISPCAAARFRCSGSRRRRTSPVRSSFSPRHWRATSPARS